MIRDPKKIQEGEKKIRMLIAGYPGIGKSTLALSAPNPLHIDVDFGIDRIEPRYRVPYIQPKDYQEILDDLTPMNTQGFDTLVFDTGGKLISLMSLWAIKKDPKYGQRDGSLSLKGYGFVGKEFVRLIASNFQRAYRVRSASDREYMKLPADIKKVISGVADRLSLSDGTTGTELEGETK